MQTRILSGKEVSSSVYTSIQSRIDKLKSENIIPGLAVILVGENQHQQFMSIAKLKNSTN